MDLFKRMIDINEDTPGKRLTAEEVDKLSAGQLKEKLVEATTARDVLQSEYDSLLSESREIRRAAEEYKAKKEQKEAASAKLHDDLRQKLAALASAAEKSESEAAARGGVVDQLSAQRDQLLADADRRDQELKEARLEIERGKHSMAFEKEESLRDARRQNEALRSTIADLQHQAAAAAAAQRQAEEDPEAAPAPAAAPAAQPPEVPPEVVEGLREELEACRKALKQAEAAAARLQEEKEQVAADHQRAREALERQRDDAQWEHQDGVRQHTELKAQFEHTTTLLATAENKAARLQRELEAKDRETRGALKAREDALRSETQALEGTVTALKDEVNASRQKITELRAAQAERTEVIGTKHIVLHDQLESAQSRMSVLMEQHAEAAVQAKEAQDKLRLVQSDLREAAAENARKEGTIEDLRRDLDEALQRAAALDGQVMDSLNAVQIREDELRAQEQDRQSLRLELQAAQAAAAQLHADKHRLESATAEAAFNSDALEARVADLQGQLQRAGEKFGLAQEEHEDLRSALSLKDRELAQLKQRLVDKEAKIDEVLRLKDEQSAKVRHMEKALRDVEEPDKLESSPKNAQRRSRSVLAMGRAKSPVDFAAGTSADRSSSAAAQSAPAAPLFRFSWTRSRAITIVIIAFIWLIGMYHNYNAGAQAHMGGHLEVESMSAHLTSIIDSQQRALATCRDKLSETNIAS
ncbi:hypothetical protein DIPPA_22091 [Diplonema papillatum]|nr:hypothetical protein DIPPA_22091 [Diplonema papillatum]